MEYPEKELLFKLYRVLNKDNQWCPALEDHQTHDIDPTWVAGMAFVIIDRYMQSIEDSKQNQFMSDVKKWLDIMMESGYLYTDRYIEE